METDISVLKRPDNGNLEDFWPRGNACPIMFVDVVGEEGLGNTGIGERGTKVGVESKCNIKEAKLVVRHDRRPSSVNYMSSSVD